jgi:hypothetical protein
MPTIDEYYSGGGGTLKASDIGDEMVVVVTGYRQHKFENADKPTLFLKLEGEEKEFRCNWTNMQRVAEMYGKDIEGWVGKTLELLPDKGRDRQGKPYDTITVRVRKTARNTPKAAAKPKFDERNPPDDDPFAP